MADPEGADFGWTAFQLPLYLMGALTAFNERLAPETTLTAGYVVLRADKKLQARPVERDLVELDSNRRAQALAAGAIPVAERVWGLIDDALGGRFDVDPRRCDDWCPYRSVCRYYKGTELGG
jgi:hypothetical protein